MFLLLLLMLLVLLILLLTMPACLLLMLLMLLMCLSVVDVERASVSGGSTNWRSCRTYTTPHGSECKIVEIDVKDFYHMGSVRRQIENSFTHVEDAEKRLLQNMLGLMLSNQYVHDSVNNQHMVANKGSGRDR